MIIQAEKRYYTPEEYLTLEEKGVDKHEYRDGEIILMTGGTTNHNQIAGNFYKRFPLQFKLKITTSISMMYACGYLNIASIPILT